MNMMTIVLLILAAAMATVYAVAIARPIQRRERISYALASIVAAGLCAFTAASIRNVAAGSDALLRVVSAAFFFGAAILSFRCFLAAQRAHRQESTGCSTADGERSRTP